MKLAKGLKTPSRKKTVAKSLADLPETLTQTISPKLSRLKQRPAARAAAPSR